MLISGSKHYSQVFSGRLAGTGEEICLKLFDERFPIPDLGKYEMEKLPRCQLLASMRIVSSIFKEPSFRIAMDSFRYVIDLHACLTSDISSPIVHFTRRLAGVRHPLGGD